MSFKKINDNIDTVDFDDLDNYDCNCDDGNDDDNEYRNIGSIRRLFKGFDEDNCKPIRTDDGFAGRRNNYIEHKSKGDRSENLSTKEYLKMIRPYLRDLTNDHKHTTESNNEEEEDNNEEDDNEEDNNDSDRAERKIQLVMQNSRISTVSTRKNLSHVFSKRTSRIF